MAVSPWFKQKLIFGSTLFKDWRLDYPETKTDHWWIKPVEIDLPIAQIDALQAQQKGHDRWGPPGKYTTLVRRTEGMCGWTVWMSDTPDEIRDHAPFVERVQRKDRPVVLIAGLGLGMIAHKLLKWGHTTDLDIVEIDPHLPGLIEPILRERFPQASFTIHTQDIFSFVPTRKYDLAWFDIWPTLDVDNLSEMRELDGQFKKHAKSRGFWGKTFLEGLQRRKLRRWG